MHPEQGESDNLLCPQPVRTFYRFTWVMRWRYSVCWCGLLCACVCRSTPHLRGSERTAISGSADRSSPPFRGSGLWHHSTNTKQECVVCFPGCFACTNENRMLYAECATTPKYSSRRQIRARELHTNKFQVWLL
jgi:hypothetical protein